MPLTERLFDPAEPIPRLPESQQEDWWCPALRDALVRQEVMLFYSYVGRYYGIVRVGTPSPLSRRNQATVNPDGTVDEPIINRPFPPWTVQISHCPFCGARLPGPLVKEHNQHVEPLIGERPNIFSMDDPDPELPEDLITNTWWKETALPDTRHPSMGERRCRRKHDWPGLEPIECRLLRTLMTAGDGDMLLHYDPRWREIGIRIVDMDLPVFEQPLRTVPMSHSPWCGRPYPISLRAAWHQLVEDSEIDANAESLPVSLATDLWWKESPRRFWHVSDAGSRDNSTVCQPPK